MAVHVINEVNRCLNCKKPMCMQACPIHTPIPMMIKAFKKENLNEAGEMLFENNPMSMICSLVCNHENQCEGHCVLDRKGESLGNVHFAIDYLANPDSYDLGDHVAIIGMGNSAMDVARTALRKGSRHVTLYARGLTSQASDRERLPTQSWMARSWLSAGSRWRSMMTARYLRRFSLMRMAIRPEWIRLRCRFRQIGRSFPSARVRRASWSTLPMV